jgi:Arc/MetJ family transcription regulator
MAVVAGLMGMRPSMNGTEKWFWAVILIFFAVIEIKSVNRDRDEQNGAFSAIGNGITRSIQENTAHFDATMHGLDDLKTQVSVVQLALQGSNNKKLSSDERRQIIAETAEYLKNGQSTNLSSFSSPTLSVVANELAQRMELAFHDWANGVDFVGETFGHQMLYAKTVEEKQRVQEQQKIKMDALLRQSNLKFARVLSDAYLVCKEMMRRIPTTPDDRAFLARLQNFAQTDQGSDDATGLRFAVEGADYVRRLAKRLPP